MGIWIKQVSTSEKMRYGVVRPRVGGSYRRRPVSRQARLAWIPAFAGMTRRPRRYCFSIYSLILFVPVVLTFILTTAGFVCPSGKILNPEGFAPGDQSPRTCEDGWVKYEGNPVFNKGTAGEWDEGGVTCFVVRHFPWGYMMWYSCAAAFDNGFGLATSDDGVNWSRNPNNPVMVPDSGVAVWGPEVLHDGERYRMWYVCNTTGASGIYYAWSDDGVSWTQSEHNPVIDHGGCDAVIWDGRQYRMFLQHSTRGQHGFELLVS